MRRENAHTKKALRAVEPIRRSLLRRMRNLTAKEATLPERVGDWIYSSFHDSMTGDTLYKRRQASADAKDTSWEVVLDISELSNSFGAETELHSMKVSRDGRLLAMMIDQDGSERMQLVLLDLSQPLERRYYCRALHPHLLDVKGFEWGSDGGQPSTPYELYYTCPDRLRRPSQVRRLSILCGESGDGYGAGLSVAEDELVLEELDDSMFMEVTRSKDHHFVTISINSKTTSEVWLVPGARQGPELPANAPHLVRTREPGVEYYVEHAHGILYILTNAGSGGELELAQTCASELPMNDTPWNFPLRGSAWTQSSFIHDMDVFSHSLVLYCTSVTDLTPHMRVIPLPLEKTGEIAGSQVDLPHSLRDRWLYGAHIKAGINQHFDAHSFHFHVTAPAIACEAYTCSLPLPCEGDYRPRVSLAACSQLAHLRSDDFFANRVQATGRDGVTVPITVVHSRKTRLDGQSPLILTAYGSYGASASLDYTPEHAILLEQGWVLGFAHVRGGGELGRKWHAAGKLQQKQTTFDDFQACAERLIELGYTQPSRLVLRASSAGALIGGVMANTQPDLFVAMILRAPFLDVLGSMMDPSKPLSIHERDEWGDPLQSKDDLEYLQRYSPLQNVRKHEYPAMMISIALNDPRVDASQALEWAMRIRSQATAISGNGKVLVQIGEHGGHHGGSNSLRQASYELAFIHDVLSTSKSNRDKQGRSA
jgi:oligopeptidase B